jgi:hypothetical protein
MKILKKSILFSGALTRSLIGIGSAALLFCALKKTRGKKKKRRSAMSVIVPKNHSAKATRSTM